MIASLKKEVGAIALVIVLVASMTFGWAMHVNAAMPQHYGSASTSQVASVGPKFVCPPPPFDCM